MLGSTIPFVSVTVVNVVPSLATRIDEAALESKKTQAVSENPLCLTHSFCCTLAPPKIASFLNCFHMLDVCYVSNVASRHEDLHPQISLISFHIVAEYRVFHMKRYLHFSSVLLCSKCVNTTLTVHKSWQN